MCDIFGLVLLTAAVILSFWTGGIIDESENI